MSGPLLEVSGLKRHFHVTRGRIQAKKEHVRAVDGVSFSLHPGKTLALVGESGCGKTTTARLILRLDVPSAGSIRFEGTDVMRMDRNHLRLYRRSVQAVFQDPYSSLSPRMRVRDIVGEPLRIHENLRGRALDVRVGELLEQVGLMQSKAKSFPHQFSGGQRQRIAIARAIALNPKLLVLDEPVSALDVSVRAQTLNLLVDLQSRLGLAYLLISHDLGVVTHMSHDIAIMYAGQIVETVAGSKMRTDAGHPYTQALLAAVPSVNPDVPLASLLEGDVANPADPPTGCRFHPRCPLRSALGFPERCTVEAPHLREAKPGQWLACHFRL